MSSHHRDITIQPLRPDGFDDLCAFMRATWTEAFGADMAPSDSLAHLNSALSVEAIRKYVETDRFLVAHDCHDLVGFLQFGDWRASPGGIEFRRLYVAPSHQNKGIGSSLLEAGLADESVAAAPRVLIGVWGKNTRAHRLYSKFGFHEIGKLPFTVDGKLLGHDLLLERPGHGQPSSRNDLGKSLVSR